MPPVVKTGTKAHLAVIGTNVFFAANYSLVKYISPALVKPFALNILRVGISLVLFWLAWLFSKHKTKIKKEHIGRFLLCGLTGVAINQMFFIKGLTLTSTIHAALLILVTPLLISVFAVWVLKEKLTFFKVLGLTLGVGGSVLLVMQKESNTNAPNYLLGDLFILINSISYTVYFILVKPLMTQYSPLQVIRMVFTAGFFMILPFGWGELAAIEWPQFGLLHWAALSGVVVTGTFLAYVFNAFGIQHLGAGVTGSYIYTQPVFAVVIATIFLNEALTPQKLLAGLCIFSGVYLVSFSKRK